MMGPLYRQLMRSKKHSLQIFKSKFNVVTWCTPCLISFNYGYMVWVKFSNLNIHIAQCTPTSHLSEGGGDDIEVSSVHRLITEGTDFTNTVTMCVHCDFQITMCASSQVSYQSHEANRFKRIIKIILNSSFFCAANKLWGLETSWQQLLWTSSIRASPAVLSMGWWWWWPCKIFLKSKF
jgi:hypothetical protein